MGTGFGAKLKQAKEKAASSGKFTKRFAMSPDEEVVMQFVTPWEGGVTAYIHEKFGEGGFFYICHLKSAMSPDGKAIPIPGMEKVPCEYCAMDKEDLKAEKIRSRDYFIWLVYDPRANDGAGGPVLFQFPWNDNSPLDAILDVMTEVQKEEKLPLTAYGIRLKQTGEGTQRKFMAREKLKENYNAQIAKTKVPRPSELMKKFIANATNAALLTDERVKKWLPTLDGGEQEAPDMAVTQEHGEMAALTFE